MHSSLVSELAGIATALLWGAAAFCWGELSRRMHSTAVAAVRLALAVVPLSAMHFAWYGSFWPADVPAASVGMLCLSGVVAAGIGDTLYIHGIHRIGPRLTLTITTLSPAIAALFALLPPMHERLSLLQVGGLAMAIAGVTLVVAERKGREAWPAAPAAFRAGIVLSVVSAVCQAFGYLSSRIGMNDFSAVPVPPFSATLIRVIAACLRCSGVMVFTGKTREASVVFRSRAAFAWLLLGVTAGPVVGIWLSMIALQGAPTGVASTLASLSPLFLIPMSWLRYGERPAPGRILATLVALGGVACLLLA